MTERDLRGRVSSEGETERLAALPPDAWARCLAQRHTRAAKPPRRPATLLDRLDRQSRLLRAAYQRFLELPAGASALSYAAEWVLDNYYQIEQAARQIREDMPIGYYRQLPALVEGDLAGTPRIFALGWLFIARAQGQADIEAFRDALAAYQEVCPLTLGELWAAPTMLRLSILECLAQALIRVAGLDDHDLPEIAPASTRESAPSRLADDLIVANCIRSLRALATHDWEQFVEDVSQVEAALRDDPAGVYAGMDFETRNRYRQVVEKLAMATDRDERQVAQHAIDLARAEAESVSGSIPAAPFRLRNRKAHVGYFLIDAGRSILEREIGYRPGAREWLARALTARPTLSFLAAIAALSALVMWALVSYAGAAGAAPFQRVLVAVVSFIPALTIAVGCVSWLVTRIAPPRTLPRLDFEAGLPAECRTMLVVPALLSSRRDAQSLIQQLELHYLRNSDPRMSFALLTDFADAPAQHMPEDAALVEVARSGVERLNAKYARDGYQPFYLFHRERRWNPAENCWMGWERKRGKLHEFNRLLRGATDTSYVAQTGDLSVLPAVRYVITLDADSVIMRDSAQRLIATLAHPLNRAEFGPDAPGGPRVVAGYTILQPRVEIQPVSAAQTPFARIFAGDTGLDLYTRAVSDVYQDLFGEGIYVGKGIYEVDAFERSLAGRIPDNALLSHDLFEGIHGRAALVSDVVILEDYPSHYLAHAMRALRWIRGDWQLLPWLAPRVPGAHGERLPNRLSAISIWKLVDNLRRSLVMPALLALLVVAWLALPGSAVVWSVFAALTLGIPTVTSVAGALGAAARAAVLRVTARGSPGGPAVAEARHVRLRPAGLDALRWAFALICLPFEALSALSAIAITLWRVFVTRRRLLQWTTAARVARMFGAGVSRRAVWAPMAVGPVVALGLLALVVWLAPWHALVAAPFLLGWLASPEIVYRAGRVAARVPQPLTREQRHRLRVLARRTWLYFETFVGPEDNWLPPDHYQEHPLGAVAHQTSPTNVGLWLLSALSAYDLGYLRRLDLVARLRSTFDSLRKLQRHRGHFLNWYDTQSLAPLPPAYVSTVDSGNLAACLLAFSQGCSTLLSDPVLRVERWDGLLDALGALADVVAQAGADAEPVLRHLAGSRSRVEAGRDDRAQWRRLLSALAGEHRQELDRLILELIESESVRARPGLLGELRVWMDRLRFQIDSMGEEWRMLAPWLDAFDQLPDLLRAAETGTPLGAAWQALAEALPLTVTIAGLPVACEAAASRIEALKRALASDAGLPEIAIREALAWCDRLADDLRATQTTATRMLRDYDALIAEAEALFNDMTFGFLYSPERRVFHIGYNLSTGRLDTSYYDLLASEARLASLIAIARGDVPLNHWLHLGRPVTEVQGRQALLSWSGTMFEYLMPLLLTRDDDDTLLNESCRAVVAHQIALGRQHRAPWGISESGYYAFDQNQKYQYKAFGAPGLGYKRGLGDDLVIAPYASLLAVAIAPRDVIRNIEQFTALGMLGRYGLYEAIDYTRQRLPPGQRHAIVREYMAHHQAMGLVALTNYLLPRVMVERFHRDPRARSVEMLLQEKIPAGAPLEFPHRDEEQPAQTVLPTVAIRPWRVPVDTPQPRLRVLSQGRYTVVLTNAGGGYSQWGDLALTRWRADATRDADGAWVYVQDCDSGALWSATFQPTGAMPDWQTVIFHAHMAEFQRLDDGIVTRLDVTVAPDEVEVRRLTLTNHSNRTRRLRAASYAEVALAPRAEDQRHPAFSKLFVETEAAPALDALMCRRRPRTAQQQPAFLAHALVSQSSEAGTIAFETDRARFIGRGNSARNPAAFRQGGEWLTGTVGPVLDPILSIGVEVELAPNESAEFAFITLGADSRDSAMARVEQYRAWHRVEQAFEQARIQTELDLRQRGLDTDALQRIDLLLSALLYPHPALRAEPEVLAANRLGQSGLYGLGISGDLPILLAPVDEPTATLTELLRAHAYWRDRNIQTNLVILNERDTSYSSEAGDMLLRLINAQGSGAWLNRRDGIFIARLDHLDEARLVLLRTSARAVVKGDLADVLRRMDSRPARLPAFVPAMPALSAADQTALPPLERPAGLLFDNGFGGFSPCGREYVIYLRPGEQTPLPWVNVIANPDFGFVASESGLGCAWAVNSGENRLTPWRNDPVSDPPAEAVYLRDEETGAVWSPTPLPARAAAPYLIRHGAGYSVYAHHSHGLQQELRVFAVPDAPVKVIRLRLRNHLPRPRRITVTYYAEWVLGVQPEESRPWVVCEYDSDSQTLLARNAHSAEFGERVAFVTANVSLHGATTDREEFLGRMGDLESPEALRRIGLAGAVQAGGDPCAAAQAHVDLEAGAEQEIYFLAGQGRDRDEALQLAQGYRDVSHIDAAWQAARRMWDDLLGAVTVKTPDPSMDILLNRWLLYQAIACRLWGRTALYQSSGAFGFRDQLQDALALTCAAPDAMREYILNAARHQFEEGDVMHWWHPPASRGIRSRCSDDLLWLPFVTASYVEATRDLSILDEVVPFLTGPSLKPGEEDRYDHYGLGEAATLREHCRRALARGHTRGEHGLPLIGSGDWNDGMNRVGIEGRGESVWLGWFLYATLSRFAGVCALEGNEDEADRYRRDAESVRQAVEAHGWDGRWYRRAYYDDGTPLGSASNRECQIDALSQSWAVLSGAGMEARATQAMQSVWERLVRLDDRLVLLLTPPFDRTARDPGYIKGYLPGIRENGGQYTHAAIWTAWAYAAQGDAGRAMRLFQLLNPINHADDRDKALRYRVEPYVIAADVYGVAPHVGRGGWTWYTGSAGWMYRLGVEALLGLRRVGHALQIDPCIPSDWPGYEITYRHSRSLAGDTTYHIVVRNVAGAGRAVRRLTLDGRALPGNLIPLAQDGRTHEVVVELGAG